MTNEFTDELYDQNNLILFKCFLETENILIFHGLLIALKDILVAEVCFDFSLERRSGKNLNFFMPHETGNFINIYNNVNIQKFD